MKDKIIWAGGIVLFTFLCGFFMGKIYAHDEVITDCKVLGMTRFGNVPMGCRVGEKYQ